jgi:hypothetical protein
LYRRLVSREPTRRAVLLATVTPLASIFGSGFLIVVPILEREMGARAAVGMAAVCLLAWTVGIAIRHNVATIEPLVRDGRLDQMTGRIERASDIVIIGAYMISVTLYARILAQFVVGYVSPASGNAERWLGMSVIALITVVGLVRGLSGLETLERISLAAVLVLVFAISAAFAHKDVLQLEHGGLHTPPVPHNSLVSVLLVLGGMLITVQGFETVRYQPQIDRRARIAGCSLSQLVSSLVYVLLVVLATPLMGLGTTSGTDATLLEMVKRVAPALALPLVLCAVLSQLSAATADTEAGVGNLRTVHWAPLKGRLPYALIGAVSTILAATLATSVIIVVASRAFAAYYALQCISALRTSDQLRARVGYGALSIVLLAIAALAEPAQ